LTPRPHIHRPVAILGACVAVLATLAPAATARPLLGKREFQRRARSSRRLRSFAGSRGCRGSAAPRPRRPTLDKQYNAAATGIGLAACAKAAPTG
jgi:hypothetical protein